MKAFWTFIHGMGQFASFVLPKAGQYYPYTFPEEALTRDWEAIGHDIRRAIKIHEEGVAHD